MHKPEGYDQIQPAHIGEYETLEPGGYICNIIAAREEKSANGNNMLVLAIDIFEGDHKDFYKRKHEKDKQQRPESKHQGIFRQLTDGKSAIYFKGLIQDIEASNSGFKFNFDEGTLRGKTIGFVFGRDHYYNDQGELKSSIKPFYPRTVEAIRNGVEAPPDKYPKGVTAPSQSNTFAKVTDVADDEDFPF